MKRGWWSLKIHDYPSFKPNDADLEHIAEAIKQGYDQGELIQEEDKERTKFYGEMDIDNIQATSSAANASHGCQVLDKTKGKE